MFNPTPSNNYKILFTERALDSVWTCRGYFNANGSVTITSYSREDMEGRQQEAHTPDGVMLEDDARIVRGIAIHEQHNPLRAGGYSPDSCKVYYVRNPKHVFSYTFIEETIS